MTQAGRPHDLHAVQNAFAAHLRDPARHPAPPGIETRRLAIYRDLFFNNIENFLSGFFPVLRSLYRDEDWLAMARDFYARHRSHTPYFLEIPEEFLRYLDEEREPHPGDPVFARELAHYEWLELVVDVAEEDIPARGYNPDGDLLAGAPMLTPVLVTAAYHWPVHCIDADNVPDAPLPSPVFLAVYRDRSDAVRFLEINAATARLIELLRAEPLLAGRVVAERIAAELGHTDPQAVIAGAAQMLAMLRERDIVLGTRLTEL
ncbi:MAG: DNA-binding domain-containing protein [Pseudomonadota bacterium]